MWKKIMGLLVAIALIASCYPVFAAVNAQSAGTNLGVVERVNFSTGLTATKSGDKVTVTTTAAQTPTSVTVGSPTIGGVLGTNFVAVKDGLEVDGSVYLDGTTSAAAINASGNVDVAGTLKAGTADAFSVGATGIIIDTSLYATTAGSGGNRTVCVSADGKVFSSPTACP
jgi:hypothetical protein